MDDGFCDPLELRSDSTLGVPGLVQAWRAGRVLVANALGAGVLESPALLGFLPPICDRLLGETLELPSIETWWYGESAAVAHVGPRSRGMIVKPAFPHHSMEPVFLAELEPDVRDAWQNQLAASPDQYVLEDYLPLSHAPTWQETRLQSRALMLRAYLVSDGRGDYRVLPGGLCRIATTEKDIVSTQRGGSSKDAWVLSDAPVEHVSLLKGRLQREDVARSGRMVSSRSAENLFWLGRYAERAENCARLLRAVLSRLPDSDAFPAALSALVVRTSIRQGLITDDWEESEASRDPGSGIPALRLPARLFDCTWVKSLEGRAFRFQGRVFRLWGRTSVRPLKRRKHPSASQRRRNGRHTRSSSRRFVVCSIEPRVAVWRSTSSRPSVSRVPFATGSPQTTGAC